MEFFCRIRSAFFVNFWSRSLVSNYKIETKTDARVKCDFDVTIVGVEFFGVGVESESEIRDSAHFWPGRPNFLAQKSYKFSKIMVCPHGQGERGVETV